MFKYLIVIAVSIGIASSSSCIGRCGESYNSQNICHCTDQCGYYQNCCSDYVDMCNPSSCSGRCGDSADHSKTCQCNTLCETYKDCCLDYTSECLSDQDSCVGRCGNAFESNMNCQCNSQCANFGDCCSDYSSECNSPGSTTTSPPTTGCSSQTATNSELLTISLQLFEADANRATSSDIEFNKQTKTSTSSSNDLSPENFFTYVNEAIFTKPTYSALISLLNNYESLQGRTETITEEETLEENIFLDEFMETEVGELTYNFFNSKGYAGGSKDAFKNNLRKIWFEMYDRQAKSDTSGFEHVFVGEIKSGSVSGFHNWVQFYIEERDRHLNYHGYINSLEPDLYGMQFSWHNYVKSIGGGAIGVSPEYELAVLTLCHVFRPDSACQIHMKDGANIVSRSIQTWTWSNSTPDNCFKYVASAYFLT